MVRYNQSGYCGSSRSVRATEAEKDGKLPLSRAIKVVAKKGGTTQKLAKNALLATHGGEWHHVSKWANRVNYYDTACALAYLSQ